METKAKEMVIRIAPCDLKLRMLEIGGKSFTWEHWKQLEQIYFLDSEGNQNGDVLGYVFHNHKKWLLIKNREGLAKCMVQHANYQYDSYLVRGIRMHAEEPHPLDEKALEMINSIPPSMQIFL